MVSLGVSRFVLGGRMTLKSAGTVILNTEGRAYGFNRAVIFVRYSTYHFAPEPLLLE